jgi:membrane protease YdiL (CAAX protease family)
MTSDRRLSVPALSVFYFALFLLTVGIHSARPILRFPEPGPGRVPSLLRGAGAGVAAGLAIVALSAAAVRFVPRFRELAAGLRRLIGPLGRGGAFLVAAFSAVGEEFFFRGLLQPFLGLAAVSVLFGLLHWGPSRRFWPWAVFAAVVGCALGWLYEQTGDLTAPVTAHFTVNFLNLRWLRYPTGQGAGNS